MRIIAGDWRGRTIAAPAGHGTRPTSDRAREGLFSMLASRLGTFEGLRVADLFAGTGALGLEALSRGAAHCLFVEKDRVALDALRSNIDKLAAGERSEIRAGDVAHVAPPPQPLDLVLIDPPYRTGLGRIAIERISAPGWLAGGAWASLELSGEEIELPPPLKLEAERRFGKARILLLRA